MAEEHEEKRAQAQVNILDAIIVLASNVKYKEGGLSTAGPTGDVLRLAEAWAWLRSSAQGHGGQSASAY